MPNLSLSRQSYPDMRSAVRDAYSKARKARMAVDLNGGPRGETFAMALGLPGHGFSTIFGPGYWRESEARWQRWAAESRDLRDPVKHREAIAKARGIRGEQYRPRLP